MPAGTPFNGVIDVDVRDSTPDWEPFISPTAPDGAPNVLVVLYDDTGIASWSPYGGKVQMPTLQRLADNGLRYSQWHTTALCSPTRSIFLTGRNHHQNSMACITEGSIGYPGSSAHIPPECGTMAEVMKRNGYNTYWVGKNHSVPVEEANAGATKRQWPLNMGWDRFYGFIGGESNQWYPTLVEDNHYVDQPYGPEDGYHLSKDLADHALQMLRDSHQSAPNRPWLMWFNPGANHAPHHVAAQWADKYKGMFDDGYEAYREWVLPRMIANGTIPDGTDLTAINPLPPGTHDAGDDMRPWADLSADEKKLFARMAEVFAGFSEYTDHQVGRIIDFLEQSGQMHNTLIMYCADNGASGEGSPNGSVNENKFFNGWPDDMADNLAHIDDLGSPNTYNHYPTGWAVAFSTPFKMFKRYSYAGGTADPLVICWPKGIKAKGEVRDQYHHATDIVPTILDCCGIEFPATLNGHDQVPLPGVSMRYSFDDAKIPTRKERQYYAMLGTRGIWQDGWKAVTVHGPTSGLGHFEDDEWELFHVDSDRSEAHNLADDEPKKLEQMINLWFEEAGKYNVLPLDDRLPYEILNDPRPQPMPPQDTYVYYPDAAEVPEQVAANIRGRSYRVVASVDLDSPDASGVLMASGSRFGGHSLFLKDRKLWYVYNFLGVKEQKFVSSPPIEAGRHIFGIEFTKTGLGEHHESLGSAKLWVDDAVVAEGPMQTQIGSFNLCGDGLCVGRDSSDPVTDEYPTPSTFSGGTIIQVEIGVGEDRYIDLEKEAASALARE
jgi:arylsulfatase A-like enzyme